MTGNYPTKADTGTLRGVADKEVPVLSPLLTASADVTHEQDERARVNKTNPAVLRWVREHREFTLEDAAGQLGWSPQFLERVEAGFRPTIKQLRRMAELYDCSLPVLLMDEVPSNDSWFDWHLERRKENN